RKHDVCGPPFAAVQKGSLPFQVPERPLCTFLFPRNFEIARDGCTRRPDHAYSLPKAKQWRDHTGDYFPERMINGPRSDRVLGRSPPPSSLRRNVQYRIVTGSASRGRWHYWG